jgi:hypothetical protein
MANENETCRRYNHEKPFSAGVDRVEIAGKNYPDMKSDTLMSN